MKTKGPVLLAILDGWGVGEATETNAVHVAKTPNMDRWWHESPHTTLTAHGTAVGLPAGQMGNSEVGHLNIGAGRVVYQDYSRINKALDAGEFSSNEALGRAMNSAKEHNSALHLMGLLSDGGVHSHLQHLIGLVEMAGRLGLENVFIHAFMDGRDTPPRSGKGYMETLQAELSRIGTGKVAVVAGRYYAMDRDNRWDRVQLAWQALVGGHGITATDPVLAVEQAYERDESDEFIKPVVIVDADGEPRARVRDNDSVIFFNFRADRARQLTKAFREPEFSGFDSSDRPALANYTTMTVYDKEFELPVAFPPLSMEHLLGEELSNHGLHQLRIAETEKYAHVTFFFNGGREEPYANEDRILIPSPREVATYDQKPEMSAHQVTEELLAKISQVNYDLIVLNFANGDMVGHSGQLAAAVKACEAVDECLGRLVEAICAQQGTVLVTADHGNAEQMADPLNGESFTAHTANPVPFVIIDQDHKTCRLAKGGALRDIAPTILELLGLQIPAEMDGKSLLG